MNHEIIKKSIKRQSKQRTDNGDILEHTNHRHRAATQTRSPASTFRPFIPTSQSTTNFNNFNRSHHIAAISTQSFWFYAVSSVILALCCLTTPTSAASENYTQQLPSWVFIAFMSKRIQTASSVMIIKCIHLWRDFVVVRWCRTECKNLDCVRQQKFPRNLLQNHSRTTPDMSLCYLPSGKKMFNRTELNKGNENNEKM